MTNTALRNELLDTLLPRAIDPLWDAAEDRTTDALDTVLDRLASAAELVRHERQERVLETGKAVAP